jgi:hypothetical protein
MPYKDINKERERCRKKSARRRASWTEVRREEERLKNRLRMRALGENRSPERKSEIQTYNREYLRLPEVRTRRNAAARIKRADRPWTAIASNLRTRIYETLVGRTRYGSMPALLGCSVDQFLGHLEINFQAEMTWENYGSFWHVDHRRPCASFDLTKPEEQRACFNWKNLQPLEAVKNLSKGAKLLEYKSLVGKELYRIL